MEDLPIPKDLWGLRFGNLGGQRLLPDDVRRAVQGGDVGAIGGAPISQGKKIDRARVVYGQGHGLPDRSVADQLSPAPVGGIEPESIDLAGRE